MLNKENNKKFSCFTNRVGMQILKFVPTGNLAGIGFCPNVS